MNPANNDEVPATSGNNTHRDTHTHLYGCDANKTQLTTVQCIFTMINSVMLFLKFSF